jgi:hypothetical protein
MLAVLATSIGCSFIARGPDQYRDDTQAVLDTRAGNIKACYDQQLAGGSLPAGEVTINFTVEKKTGYFVNAEVDPSRTTAPEPLANCILSAVDGLQLTPEDRRDGLATFSWVFSVGAPAA